MDGYRHVFDTVSRAAPLIKQPSQRKAVSNRIEGRREREREREKETRKGGGLRKTKRSSNHQSDAYRKRGGERVCVI